MDNTDRESMHYSVVSKEVPLMFHISDFVGQSLRKSSLGENEKTEERFITMVYTQELKEAEFCEQQHPVFCAIP